MTHASEEFIPAPSQTVGPFFHIGLTHDATLGRIAGPDARGEHIRLTVRALDNDGAPIPDALIEIWQADASGKYNHPDDLQQKTADPAVSGFGRLGTKDKGEVVFETVRPGRVPGVDGALQAPHFSVHVFARGILRHVSTRIYFAGDAANAEDAVLQLVPAGRRETLLAHPDAQNHGVWKIDLRLCGEEETVFFDA